MIYRNRIPIILASASPRRKELLKQAKIDFSVVISDVDEDSIPHCLPQDYVRQLARLKADSVSTLHPGKWVLAADTIVALDDRILEKPGSRHQAVDMLTLLSDRTHEVYTGFCLACSRTRQVHQQEVITSVRFKPLPAAEINLYIDTKEPFDKAGGYGIQGMGAFLVKSISGSYTNVVGLPVCEVLEALADKNIIEY